MKTYPVSYVSETDPNINNDILTRKEFLMFKKSVEATKFVNELEEEDEKKNIIPKFLIPKSNYLELKSYQLFVRNFLNPNTPYSRLLLTWSTGLGKTIGSLSIGIEFIKYYQLQERAMSEKMGTVYVIGFTQNIFRDELLKHPEFGFITKNELEKLKLLRKNSHIGNPQDIDKLKKFYSSIKRRLYSRKGNGFFKFIGYKELYNHLVLFDESIPYDKRPDLTILTKQELDEQINAGVIKINTKLLEGFANSLIICDEIHNVYNTFEKNNWGISLQIILNHHKSCRALFLSATPLNNSPTEIIDLLNLLLPRSLYPLLLKQDFFNKPNEEGTKIISLEKEKEISDYLKGRVSFIQDQNPKSMATKEIVGESIQGIDYLKFIRCNMSKFHYNTYKHALEESKSSIATLGHDGQYLVDYALPNPLENNSYSKIGLYKPNDIKVKINNAKPEWQEKYGIKYNNVDEVISGNILKMGNNNNLKIISNKYETMMQTFIKNVKDKKGKTFIYHNNIHMTGTLLIKEIMIKNGVIGEFDNVTDNTRCCVCSNPRKDHTKEQLSPITINTVTIKKNKYVHHFQPIRFAIIHSNLEKNQISRSLEKFNNLNNIDGSNVYLLIGSKIIKESHSMNSVRNIFIMSKPDNISTLIQIIGRALRLNSHKLLPKSEQHVEIKIFVSSTGKQDLSIEENKYLRKIQTYKVIQLIEKIIHENSIDAYFNYDVVWPESPKVTVNKKYGLSILPYYLKQQKTLTLNEMNLNTFNVYYANYEVKYIIYIIKLLFIETSSVWTYTDLLAAVMKPPFHVEIDPQVISKDLFNIALNSLMYNSNDMYVEPLIKELVDTLDESNIVEKINNPHDKIILISNGIQYIITQVGELYSLVPIVNNEVFVDAESVFRQPPQSTDTYIDISQYLTFGNVNNFNEKKKKFIKKWKSVSLLNLEGVMCDFGNDFHVKFLEEIIEYLFNLLTSKNNKGPNHDFYIKMLYFYDIYKLVLWNHLITDDALKSKYSKYVTDISLKINKSNKNVKKTGNNNILIDTLNKSSKDWVSTGMINKFNKDVKEIDHSIFVRNTKKSNIQKVRADLLPVGHFLDKTPKIYEPDLNMWSDYNFTNNLNIKENNIIIGYDKRSSTSIVVKFKIREPKTLKNDVRKVEKGSVCSTKSKSYLTNIAKKLDIVIDNIDTVDNLCELIRSRLIYLELKEREKTNGVKYFYNIFENQS
jgi:superfamily II DNA or RNA helicase